MLKFENVIKNLSLEEKVALITSDKFGNQTIDHYDFPTFSLTNEMKENASNVILPTYNMLGSTWNEELVNNFAEQVSLNSVYYKQKHFIGVPTFVDGNISFGCCQYLVGKLAAAYVRGIENGGAFSCLNKISEDCDSLFLGSEIAFKEGMPSAILSSGNASFEMLNDSYYKGLRISCVSAANDLIARIYEGNHLVVVENVDPLSAISDAITAYKNAKEEYLNERITLADLNTLEKLGKILDEEKLDEALDQLLLHLVSYVERLKEDGDAFDVRVLKQVAEESIVLLENNNILPLDNSVKVALIGEEAVSPIMNCTNCNLSKSSIPLEFYNRYELNLVGHSYGYSNEVKNQERLIEEAISLSSKAQVSIVYIGTEIGSTLPKNQLDLIKALHENNAKMVGVLSGKLDIDLDFVDMFDALIYVGFNTLETIEATVKIVLGLVNPSGRLTHRYAYSLNSFGIKYSVGYGLSYSNFNYSQFKLMHNGISMTIENLDNITGSDVITLYVSRVENNTEGEKELKGFAKCKLRAKDYQKVTLLFDEYTFTAYKDNKLGILGGVYNLYVCRNENEVLYKTEISLDQAFEDKNAYDFEVVERNADDELINKFVGKTGYYTDNTRMSLNKKIIIETSIYAYFVIALLILGLSMAGLLIVFGALIAVITCVYIVAIKKTINKEKEYKKLNSPHPINDMVNKLENFVVSSKAEFKPTIQKEESSKVETSSQTAEEVLIDVDAFEEENEEEIFYATCEFELKDDTIEYSNEVDFGLLCNNFYEFALKNGLIIEQSSIRMLISSICSTKLLFLRSTRMDLLPKVIRVLNEFLGNDENIFDVTNLENNSLIWKTVEEKAVHTDFVLALYQAKKYRKHLNLITLNNVNVETMNDYFEEYFKYCSNPGVNYNVNFGTSERKELFTLPNNLTFIIIPESYEYIENITHDVAVNSSSLEIQVRENELISDAEVVVKRYPYYSFIATIETEKEHFYLSEESWKKIDDFEETLSLSGKFRVENKTVLQIESFVSALLACGADETEVFDAALATKIAPTVKSYKLYKDGKESAVIQSALERHFELDLIPLTSRVLKKKD